MKRRTFVKGTGTAAGGLTLAGCLGGSGGEGTTTTESSGETTTADSGDESTTTESSEYDVEEPLSIGSDIPYKPFEYRTTSGELTGFDVDIAKAVFGEEMGLEYEFNKTSFDTIIPSLNNGNFRIIMSAMTINDKRDEKVDFSDPYFTAYQTVAIRKDGDISKLDDLKGKTVAVQKGTTGEAAAEDLKKEFDGDLTIDSYDQITGAFNALLNNQAVAVVNDNTVNAQYVSDRDGVVFLEGEGQAADQGKDAPDYLTLTVEEYGIAFRQDDDTFREQVNEALAAIKESGRYDEIYAEYFE
ncbi:MULTISPECIES: basic amino acid ABC transporter substrate-binding protein [Halorussus]|uniref:basic amino acid ABC transporter substrate-binding protein n=1 Tax=Halorussus TaxID=1070314 RepID=UPI000E20D4C1|nr:MULTISPECIES: basic amino acid ABC transporter substrate-binding protein [Halorussus]NHN59562.1 basic amino acid ABC transporter substrate-binding protein [Halorussus sp. JP-T4]